MSKIKEQLLNEIEALSDESLKELLDFAEYLHKMKESKSVMDGENPLLKFIGGISHGSLAEGIDEELYGNETLN
ncbi:TPA: hypothetical protein ENX78_14455 [Candidatus Poribacteria bacterium]|nr:hypothetical protein [Candidatus Poribacteria bacterium]